jgi:predicted nucleic acid-binding protein
VLFLLDTGAISALMREDVRIAAWLSSIRDDSRIATCTIVRGEILFGLERLAQGRRRSELEEKALKVFAAMACESVPPSAADHYARLKSAHQRGGLALDENDLSIAASAFAIGASLVSLDTHFQRVEGLTVVSV